VVPTAVSAAVSAAITILTTISIIPFLFITLPVFLMFLAESFFKGLAEIAEIAEPRSLARSGKAKFSIQFVSHPVEAFLLNTDISDFTDIQRGSLIVNYQLSTVNYYAPSVRQRTLFLKFSNS
jgi:hypothetical protein